MPDKIGHKKIQIGNHRKGVKYKYPIKYALVDNDDFEELNKYKWSLSYCPKAKNFYALRSSYVGGKKQTVFMHRQITSNNKGKVVDHANHDTLDNRKKNLRVTSHSNNSGNAKKHSDKIKGVTLDKFRVENKWVARICIKGKRIHLGAYKTREEAGKAYDLAAKKYFGEYAFVNFN